MTWSDAVFMMPEIVLTIAASLLLLAPVTGFRGSEWSAKWVTLVVLAITGGSIVACSWAVPDMTASPMLNAMFALDAFSIFFKLLFVVVIAMIVLLSDDFRSDAAYRANVASPIELVIGTLKRLGITELTKEQLNGVAGTQVAFGQ